MHASHLVRKSAIVSIFMVGTALLNAGSTYNSTSVTQGYTGVVPGSQGTSYASPDTGDPAGTFSVITPVTQSSSTFQSVTVAQVPSFSSSSVSSASSNVTPQASGTSIAPPITYATTSTSSGISGVTGTSSVPSFTQTASFSTVFQSSVGGPTTIGGFGSTTTGVPSFSSFAPASFDPAAENPEPATLFLLAGGLAAMFTLRRRHSRSRI